MADGEDRRIADEIHSSTASRDPFASAVRATRMPMVVTDPRQTDNPIVFCNDAFVRLTGYDRDEIVGRNCRFLQGPETVREDIAKVREAIAGKRQIEIDLLNYRKDGSTFWNRLLVSPVFDEGELKFFFASQFDVTDRVRADEHRLLLTRELDHRVKNALATVQSVVVQTLRNAATLEDAADAVSGRLQAYARSHDVMTREAWATALLGDVVEGALAPFRETAAGRIAVEGPAIRLKPRIATVTSLALHELATNAARHGALSDANGIVSVRWTTNDGRLVFEWLESGGPAVKTPERRGFGSRVVERALPAEFGGQAVADYAPEGFRFRMEAGLDTLGEETPSWDAP